MYVAECSRSVPDAAWEEATDREMLAGEPVEIAAPAIVGASSSSASAMPGVADDLVYRAVKGNLVAMGAKHEGTVKVQWTVYGILTLLMLAFTLKPSVTLAEGLAASAFVFFGVEGRRLSEEIRQGVIPLPSIELLRKARIRLDLLAILYERTINATKKHMRYIMVDASKQLGRHYICMREERVTYPCSEYGNPDFILTHDLQTAFHSRIAPLSSHGEGWGSGIKKNNL